MKGTTGVQPRHPRENPNIEGPDGVVQTPKPLSGKGGGKKHPVFFASSYFPTHNNRHGVTKPYELLWPAKQATPPAATPAARHVLAPARPDTSRALDMVLPRSQPLQGRELAVPSPGEEPIMGEQMGQDRLQDATIDILPPYA